MQGTDRLAPTLEGEIVRIEPLHAEHEAGLREAASDPAIWRWMPTDASTSPEHFHRWLEEALERQASGEEVPFAILDAHSGAPIGSTRLLALRPAHRGVEIGWTWLAPSAWGSGANLECKLLLLRYAFEQLDCIRVELKTDELNERSRRAILGIGAKYEGTFRSHMIVRGEVIRDSAYYSIIASEWPAVRARLEERLDGRR